MYLAKTKTFFAISLIVILVIILHYLGWIKPLENFLRHLIYPGSKLMYSISVDLEGQTETFNSPEDLKAAYKKLKGEFNKAKIDQTNYQLILNENKKLREQLNFLQKHNYQYLGGEVAGKNIDPLGSTLIINRGATDGVKVGQPVIVEDGILVGKIARVENDISIIRLINDNQSKIAATVINKDKSLGLVEGGYGISVKMDFIPQNETVNVGDSIITSGLEQEIPRGLLIGTVEVVEKEPYQPFQRAILKPLVDLSKITVVSIITE